MSEKITHVRRLPLPWRVATAMLTECGHQSSEFAQTADHEEFFAMVKELGQQRAALFFCMTCWSRMRFATLYGQPVDGDPIDLIERECNSRQTHELFRKELRAIARLIEAHRDEFDGLITDQDEMVSPEQLSSKRAERARRKRASK